MDTLVSQIVALGVVISAMAIIFSSIYERPKRKEVQEMIDGKLEAVNQKIDHVAKDVTFIRSAVEEKKKR